MRKTTAGQHPCGALRFSPNQNPDRLLSGKFPSVRKSEHPRSNSLRNTPPPKSSRTPQEKPHFVALSAGAISHGNGAPERSSCGIFPPRCSKLLCGKSSSSRNFRPKAHLSGRHFEKIELKNEF
jgi:hypothetical protein